MPGSPAFWAFGAVRAAHVAQRLTALEPCNGVITRFFMREILKSHFISIQEFIHFVTTPSDLLLASVFPGSAPPNALALRMTQFLAAVKIPYPRPRDSVASRAALILGMSCSSEICNKSFRYANNAHKPSAIIKKRNYLP